MDKNNTKTTQDWRHVVECKGRGAEARKLLAKLLTGNENALDGADVNYINAQDYITGVPVEIALTSYERKALMETTPACRWIVTGVSESSVDRMVTDYGYRLASLPKQKFVAAKPKCSCEAGGVEPTHKFKVAYSVNGKRIEASGEGSKSDVETAIEAFMNELSKKALC